VTGEPLTRYDAVVLGAGPSGSATALALARGGLTVLIVEEQRRCTFKVGESLPGVAGKVIGGAGFAGVLQKVSHIKCSGNRSSWGSSEIRLRPGLLNPYGGGVHVDRAQLDKELLGESIAAGTHV
jgi:flavin-dependent dehydrogenase